MTLPQPDPAFRWSHESWGSSLRCVPIESAAQHLFTSRQLQLPEDRAWQSALGSLHARPNRLMRVRQVHGNSVRVIGRGHAGQGASNERPDADALVSNEPGLVLAVMVADCVPILVADPGGAAAAIHAGWRGTCARVASTAIEAMVRTFGTRPEKLVAAIGPSIGPDDYEVGNAVADAFLAAGHTRPDVERWFWQSTPKPHLDLWTANRDQLIAAGLRPDRIFTARLSTFRHPAVFDSYRAEGERAGRMGALICVPG